MLNDKKGISLIVLVLIAVVVIVIGAISIVLVVNKDDSATKDNNTQITEDNNNQIENNKNNTSNDKVQEEDSNFYETWGASEIWTAGKMEVDERFAINFPKYSGYTEGKGLVAEQVDGTYVIVAAENDNSPAVDKMENFLPTYFSEIQYTLEQIYGLLSENFQFHIKNDKAVTVGKYAMHSFDGTFSFDEDGDHYEYQYVVYVTQLKSNGAYAYWVVYDVTDDQSKGNLIQEHALNMAKTFREEQ